MANPQPDQFTRISNELLEALARIRISGEENQVFLVILRKTYGFQQKTTPIALEYFNLKTGLTKSHICRAIAKLLAKNIITKNGNTPITTYGIQKDYSQWKPLPKKATIAKSGNDHHQKRKFSLPKKGHIKEKKETSKEKKIYVEGEAPYDLSLLLLDKIKKNKGDFKEPNLQLWSKDMDLLLRIDKRNESLTAMVITWCQQDSFWQSNILSPGTLRKQFDKLQMQMNKKEKQYGVIDGEGEKRYGVID